MGTVALLGSSCPSEGDDLTTVSSIMVADIDSGTWPECRLLLEMAGTRSPGGSQDRDGPRLLKNSGSQGAQGAPARSGAGEGAPRKRRAGVRGGVPIFDVAGRGSSASDITPS